MEYLTIVETAELLRVTPQTVRNWIKGGVFPAYQLNPLGKLLIKASDVDKAIEQGKIIRREC